MPRQEFESEEEAEKKNEEEKTTISGIRRLARKGGVRWVSFSAYGETRNVSEKFLEEVLKDAISYCKQAKKKKITPLAMMYALKKQTGQLNV
jgi:histone H3/H4